MRERYQEYRYTRMPWGQYRGRWLCEVPTEYIKWAIKTWQDQAIQTMLAVELQRRDPGLRK